MTGPSRYLLAATLLGQTPPDDARAPVVARRAVVVLPVAQRAPEPGASPLEPLTLIRVQDLLRDAVAASADLRLVSLDAEALALLLDLPDCRRAPRCLGPLLPAQTERVLEVTLAPRREGVAIGSRWEDRRGVVAAEASGYLPGSPDAAWALGWVEQLFVQERGLAPWPAEGTSAPAAEAQR